jgi:hypothetical protein
VAFGLGDGLGFWFEIAFVGQKTALRMTDLWQISGVQGLKPRIFRASNGTTKVVP